MMAVDVLLLHLSDEFLLVVQLVSQAADLLLMSLAVGVDLLLHRFLNTQQTFPYNLIILCQVCFPFLYALPNCCPMMTMIW